MNASTLLRYIFGNESKAQSTNYGSLFNLYRSYEFKVICDNSVEKYFDET